MEGTYDEIHRLRLQLINGGCYRFLADILKSAVDADFYAVFRFKNGGFAVKTDKPVTDFVVRCLNDF